MKVYEVYDHPYQDYEDVMNDAYLWYERTGEAVEVTEDGVPFYRCDENGEYEYNGEAWVPFNPEEE